MAQIISVLSGKGGVGKTLITGAIGLLLARKGKKVLLIDGDMGLRSLDLVFGIENDCFYHVGELAQGKCFTKEAVIPIQDNLDFLAATQTETWENISTAAIETVLEDIGCYYDYILIDCPAGLGGEIRFIGNISDISLIVITSSWASKRSAEKMYSFLPSDLSTFMVLNQFAEKDDTKIGFHDMLETIDEDLFGGVIPYSNEIDRLGHNGNLKNYQENIAFGQAMISVLNTILNHRTYPITKWDSILHLADKENKTADENPDEQMIKIKNMWNRKRMAYKWRRRR